MKYENAKDLLPPELLEQVQKYAAGKLLYVPIAEEAKAWGTASGYRQKLLKRNQMIYNEFVGGKTVSELADAYFLSLDSIKKIVYGKKEGLKAFEPTIECAVAYSEAGLAEEWIRAFYMSRQHDMMPFPQQYLYFGITKMPLRLIREADSGAEAEYADILGQQITQEPLIVRYRQRQFCLQGQKELFWNLKARKINAYPVFILITEREEYQTFMKEFGKHFQPVRI